MNSDDCNVTAASMAPLSLEGYGQELRRSAGNAFLNHLNNTIAEESKVLYQVIRNHLHLRDFVNKIELRFFGDGQQVHSTSSSSLDHRFPRSREDGSTYLFFTDKFSSIPLSQIKAWNIFVGGQNLRCQNWENEIAVRGVNRGQLKVSLTARGFFGKDTMIGGDVCQLSELDFERFSNGAYGSSELKEYLDSGEVLNSPNAVFVPYSLTFFGETRTQYAYNHHLHVLKKLRLKSSSSEVNKDRLNVIKAFGTKKQDGIKLNENNCLKKWIRELADIAALMDNVKLSHDGEKVSAKLSHGELFQLEGSDFEPCQGWKVPVSTTIADLRPLVVEVSGIPYWRREGLDPFDADFNRIGNEGRIQIYVGPVIVYGCNHSIQHGEGHVDYKVTAIAFSLENIKDTLEALGIDYQNATTSPSATLQDILNALL